MTINKDTEVYQQSIDILIAILGNVFERGDVKAILFGSRARGDYRETSDIDLGILHNAKLDSNKIAFLRDRIENSIIPYKVDVIDLTEASEEFVKNVLSEGVVIWNG